MVWSSRAPRLARMLLVLVLGFISYKRVFILEEDLDLILIADQLKTENSRLGRFDLLEWYTFKAYLDLLN